VEPVYDTVCRVKAVLITPGTGNFHCGSCLRDAALVREMRRCGHDVLCVPLYLPLVLEEEPLTDAPIFFGGVNVYLQQKFDFFQKTPRWIDRVLDQPRLLRRLARGDNMTNAHELGALAISMLRGEEGRQVKEVRRLAGWLAEQGRPDIIFISNALLLGIGVALKRSLQVPMVCTLQGEDSFLDDLPESASAEAWSILRGLAGEVDRFIAVSNYYGELMGKRLAIDSDRMHVVLNGIDFSGFEDRGSQPEPPVIGFFARMCPAKGLHTLVDAFIRIRKLPDAADLRLHIGGAMTVADRGYIDEQAAKVQAAGLADDVVFFTNLSRAKKIDFYRGLSLVSVPAMYGESFGLYVIEALACGVPLVQPDHAAFRELLHATGGGILVLPNDEAAYDRALLDLALDREKNLAMGAAGRDASREKFSVETMAEGVLAVFKSVG
jgi:glycosyltransferase involved in cell wall biosynthesis